MDAHRHVNDRRWQNLQRRLQIYRQREIQEEEERKLQGDGLPIDGFRANHENDLILFQYDSESSDGEQNLQSESSVEQEEEEEQQRSENNDSLQLEDDPVFLFMNGGDPIRNRYYYMDPITMVGIPEARRVFWQEVLHRHHSDRSWADHVVNF